MQHHRISRIVLILLMLILGCDEEEHESERLAAMAQQHADRQAEQSLQMARMQQEVASGSRALVAADAEARRDLVQLQENLASQQATLDQQRDQLEDERQAIAADRLTESRLAPLILSMGLLLAALLPLLICWQLLRRKDDPVSELEVIDVLMSEVIPEETEGMIRLDFQPGKRSPRMLRDLSPNQEQEAET
ncbi:hypothetical protein [Calycomorphotria hydatis]|uniref:Chromosome partition protein Smc n=1 Tax=Calycomorphotria hydatis TaxID=2528027 RepID=A0A517TEC4_9PLAN|nr:hypothetical protein [Calycomorphotria hydatis]QDT66724.1 hypothetical protein V22_39950 [Calycomorphotria hydatis]